MSLDKAAIDVAAAVIVADGKVLAARRRPGLHLAGYWEFPGGKIEAGESPQGCLQRELDEELGLSCLIGRYLGQSIYDYGDKRVCLVAYLASVVAGSLAPVDHDRILWLPAEELPALQWAPADVPLVELAIRHLCGGDCDQG